MKSIIYSMVAMLAVAMGLASCNNEDELATSNKASYTFDFNFSRGNAETRTVKTEWNAGDVIFLVLNGFASEKVYVTFDGTEWSAPHYDSDNTVIKTDETFAAKAASAGTCKAVWMYGADNESCTVENGCLYPNGKNASPTETLVSDIESINVTGNTISATFVMTQPENFVKISIKGITDTKWRMACRDANAANGLCISNSLNLSVANEYSVASTAAPALSNTAASYVDNGELCFMLKKPATASKNTTLCLWDGTTNYNKFFNKSLPFGSAVTMSGPVSGNLNGWGVLVDNADKTGTLNGYEWVDLGLPSGTKWATCNIGADAPEAYGNYFSWGDTRTKVEYTTDNCPPYGLRPELLGYYGWVNDMCLVSKFDAATANWSSAWRMPTKDDVDELISAENSSCTWIDDYNDTGVSGLVVISNINSKAIFLPAAGHKVNSTLSSAGVTGMYWTSKANNSQSGSAYHLQFGTSYFRSQALTVSGGLTVRPVFK